MQVDMINERARWESILGLSDRISVRAHDALFQRLTAEENLFKEVAIVGLLRNTRTLDIGDVVVFGPGGVIVGAGLAEQAYAAGERTQAAAARAEVAARRAEIAADQAEMFADRAERTAQRIDAMVEKMEYQSMTREYEYPITREYQSMAERRRALRLRYAQRHSGLE
jgi:hypothetical protein